MNGRVYEPVLGRFLSADPFIGDVTDSQEYNRYSYVGNNPMSATDPSGYLKLKDLFMVSHYSNPAYWLSPKAYKQYEPMLRGIFVSAALTYFSWGIAAPYAAAAGGAVSGFESSLLNGGSVGHAFKSGAIGGVIGGVTGSLTLGIGNISGDLGYFGTAIAHGAVQGAATQAMGGSFRHGFYAGVFSSGVGGHIGGIGRGESWGYAARVVASAIVGGTASTIGGGKFANGAISGAFVRLYNDERHTRKNRIQFNDSDPTNNRKLAQMLGRIRFGTDPTDGSGFKSAEDIDAIEIKGTVPVFIKYASGHIGQTTAIRNYDMAAKKYGPIVGYQITIDPQTTDHIATMAHELYHAAAGSVYGYNALVISGGGVYHWEAYARQNEVGNAFGGTVQYSDKYGKIGWADKYLWNKR